MADWHLSALDQALVHRGWSVQPLTDEWVWVIQRGSRSLRLEFARFDGLGNDLASMTDSYACHVVGGAGPGLYFFKRASPKWHPALSAFVDSLDDPG